MKTFKVIPTLIFAMMFLLFSGLSAYAIKPALAPAQHIQKIISETIKYPAQALKNASTGSVDVLFTINDEGQLVVKKISTDNRMIAEDVKAQLSKACFKDVNIPYNQFFRINITFKLVG
ncbi:MAG: hypothetical protein WCK34_05165 [Bacteroidota bacterium]